jgi:hypothetical protein
MCVSDDVISSSPVSPYQSTLESHSSFSLAVQFDLRNHCQADKSCHLKLRTTRYAIFPKMEGQSQGGQHISAQGCIN